MRVYTGKGLGDFYYQLIRDITEHGRKVNVRGYDCLELPDRVCFEYTAPGHCWMRIPGRKWNVFLALAEIVWILSGSGNVDWISYFGETMRQFSDGGSDFHGAYGKRLRRYPTALGSHDQIEDVIQKLTEDKNSRQAVMMIWDPAMDSNLFKSKDIPCNNWVCYELRDGILNQSVVIRSNDVVWGATYNAVQFSYLHAFVAGVLGVKIGKLTYFVQNLHYYLDLYKPTLSNLIERAYDISNPIVAESAVSFGPFGERELDFLKKDVEISLERPFRDLMNWEHTRSIWNGHTKEIADMLSVFTRAKWMSGPDAALIETLSGVEQPFRDLMADFYEGKGGMAGYIAEFLRRNNDVCA